MSWFMRICVGDLTGSSEVIFQILRKTWSQLSGKDL